MQVFLWRQCLHLLRLTEWKWEYFKFLPQPGLGLFPLHVVSRITFAFRQSDFLEWTRILTRVTRLYKTNPDATSVFFSLLALCAVISSVKSKWVRSLIWPLLWPLHVSVAHYVLFSHGTDAGEESCCWLCLQQFAICHIMFFIVIIIMMCTLIKVKGTFKKKK